MSQFWVCRAGHANNSSLSEEICTFGFSETGKVQCGLSRAPSVLYDARESRSADPSFGVEGKA